MNNQPSEKETMSSQQSLSHIQWRRIIIMFRNLVSDPQVGRRAMLYFAGLFLFLLTLSGLNVINSYVGRDFMTAIDDHDRAGFWRYALLMVLVFASLTIVSVTQRWTEESLALLWRKWLTWRIFRRYADHRVYWRLVATDKLDNPDQRIAEDIRAFTTTTLSFLLMLMNGVLTVIAFSGVLWTISPLLFIVAVAYAGGGTWLILRLGRPLVKLNYDQLDREADFRSSLIHLRDNADVVALTRREDLWIFRSGRYLDDLADNQQRIIGINRNVGFFMTGYNWLIQLIPALFVAPLFIDGRVEFGVITQAALAFTQLLGAFSLIITQFQSISSFAAVVTRVNLLVETSLEMEQDETTARDKASPGAHPSDPIAFQDVSLLSGKTGEPLVAGLTVEWPSGQPVLVFGADEAARDALFLATAGTLAADGGLIARPPLEQMLFVTERPYLCPGTLRELFLRPHPEGLADPLASLDEAVLSMPDGTIQSAMTALGIGDIIQRFEGLNSTHDWDSELSLEEQQLLVIARALACEPRFALLDRPGTSLSVEALDRVMKALLERDITPIVFAKTREGSLPQTASLELMSEGKWNWQSAVRPQN
jgi:putative ATP-binding cassette transporter